ncbi:MAG: putative metal-binding motif-containing protein [Alphaproteobacteria bacterium]|nr:putative metal-binding motif-containing protein [Alphaproteobacteria bacterium]
MPRAILLSLLLLLPRAAAALDADGDGADETVDCDDDDPTVFPDAPEICDGRDEDCSGVPDDLPPRTFYLDVDGDGWGTPNRPGATMITACADVGYVPNQEDCNDLDPGVHPGAVDVPGNGRDEDCDGVDAVAPPDTDPPDAMDTASDSADTGLEDTDGAGPDTEATDTAPPDTHADTGAPAPGTACQGGCRHGSGGWGLGAWIGLSLALRRRRRG